MQLSKPKTEPSRTIAQNPPAGLRSAYLHPPGLIRSRIGFEIYVFLTPMPTPSAVEIFSIAVM